MVLPGRRRRWIRPARRLFSEGKRESVPCAERSTHIAETHHDTSLRDVPDVQAMEEVPECQDRAEIRAHLPIDRRVVNPVQPRRDDESSKPVLDRRGQTNIRMVKKDRSEGQGFPGPKLGQTDTQDEYLESAIRDRQKKLTEMETDARRHIEIEIRVVRRVKPPKDRKPMVQKVPGPKGIIEQGDGDETAHDAPSGPRGDEAVSLFLPTRGA